MRYISVDSTIVRDVPKNRPLVVGIRAEHLFPGTDHVTHYLEAVNVEQLGNETAVAFDVGSELWTAKWTGQWTVAFGQKVPVQILPEFLLFFDAKTGKLIKSAEHVKRKEVVAI